MIQKLVATSLISVSALAVTGVTHGQSVTDFVSWTLTQDPVNALFTAANSSADATLTAGSGVIPAGTDIGFSSVDGSTVAGSSAGNYFSASSSFSLAIDYNLTLSLPLGFGTSGLFIGFGIGEDATGIDSAGITLGAVNAASSTFLALAGTARVNDSTQPVASVTGTPSLAGTFFVSYDHLLGDVVVGAASTPGASVADGSHTFADIASLWDGEGLLASFFMRSDNPLVSGVPFPLWSGTSASSVFSNFRVLEGSASAVPEPSTYALIMGLFACSLMLLSRRKR